MLVPIYTRHLRKKMYTLSSFGMKSFESTELRIVRAVKKLTESSTILGKSRHNVEDKGTNRSLLDVLHSTSMKY